MLDLGNYMIFAVKWRYNVTIYSVVILDPLAKEDVKEYMLIR
jgi:hypothetical protein